MRRSSRSINDKYFCEWERDFGGECFNLFLEASVTEWSKCVEEGLNEGRINCDHDELESQPKRRRTRGVGGISVVKS